jgi:cell wall-associated NlpC family hydrolase
VDTAGEEKALEYAAELRDAGRGLNEQGREALESFIAAFLEYAAVRDYENGSTGSADSADVESRQREYQEAATAYMIYESWRYTAYDAAGLEEIISSAEFAALPAEDRELFLFYVESGDPLSLYTWIENLRNTALEETERRADALVYTFYYHEEKEESRFSWVPVLAGHRAGLAASGVDNKTLKALEPLFAPNVQKTYQEGLEQKMYRIGSWFDRVDEWDQTQYREDADISGAEFARAALETGWQAYQTGINMDMQISLMIQNALEKLRYVNKDSELLEALKTEKENILTAAQKKYNDYVNNEYNAAITAIDQSCADYNAAVDLADVYYGEMAGARLQLRKKQEIYDWAESIYLKDFGTNYDEYYVTPQEKLVQVRYARDRALIAVEVLQEILGGAPARSDADYSQALESYRESRRAYYLAQAVSYEAARVIARQETVVREAEFAEEAARNQFVSENTSVSAGPHELVYLVDNGDGTYKPVLAYTLKTTLRLGAIPTHDTVKKPGVEIDEAAFREYFGDTGAVSIEKTGKTETMTLAEWEAGEWLKKMGNRGIDYFNDVILASLYIKFCSAEDSGEGKAWFGNESDPRPNGDYTLGNIPLETNFHGLNIKNRYDEAKRAALQEAYNRVMRQSGGEEDIAYYLLYRGRNLAADSITREEDLLKSQAIKKLSESLGQTHERYVIDVKVNTGIAIGYTAAGVALAIGAIFIKSLLPLSIEAFSMAAIFYAIAGNYEFVRRQINSLWGDVKNLGDRYNDMINGTNTQFRDKYGAWTEAAARLNAEREKLNLLYYGSAHNTAGEGEKILLSYDSFRNSLENMLKNGGANSIVTIEDAISVYDRALYENSRAETGSTVIGALGILNAALDEKSGIQKGLMDGEIERLKGRQEESLGLYRETVNSALAVPQDRQEELRTLALKAGDPSLDIAERREASAEYERLITELSMGTEDLRENIQVLLDHAFGDNSWNSTEHGKNIIDLEGELFGTWTRYDRPTESYTENEIVLLKEASLAALETDTALRLAVKEQEWGLIIGDFLNQYNTWQEQVNQIRQSGLSEWDKARSRMNEGYNNWRKKFSDEYQAKAAAWDFSYLEFVNEKQLWIEDQYLYAVNVGNSGLFEYTEDNADQVIGQALAKLSVERMNRESIDPVEYTNTLLQDSILGELLARMDKLGNRGEAGAQKIRTAVKRTSASESLAQASKLIGEMDADMQNAAAKLAAQQAQQLIEEAINQLYDRLDGENRAMLEWEEHLVQSAGYRIDGQIRREAVVDSALFSNYTVTQTVHRYESYVPDSGPATGVDLSVSALKDMDADTIMYMAEAARLNLNKWGERIFGRIENNKIMEHPAPHGKNNGSGNPITVRDGALGVHIGYEPILKTETSYLNSPLEDAEDPGSGELGKILLDFLWNGQVSAMGYYEMGRAVYDQKFWAKVYSPNFEIPTIRSTVDFTLDIVSIALGGVLSPLGASLLTLADDLLFAGLDAGLGYRSTDEVMKNLTSSVASTALSVGFGSLGKTGVAQKITNWAGKSKVGSILLKTGTAAAKSYTTSVAMNAIQSFNFETREFDTKGFVESLFSAQTLSGAVTAVVNTGLGGLTDKISNRNQKLFGSLAKLGVAGISEASRYGVYAIESMVSGEGSLGERLGQAYENMGGVTLNIANLGSILDMAGTLGYGLGGNFSTTLGDLGQKFSGVGLLEMNLGLDGPSFALGTGGIDVAGSLYNTAKHGLNYMALQYGNYGAQENRETLIENYLYGDWAAENTSMRIMNGSDILQLVDSTVLGENTMGYTTRQDGKTGRVFDILDMGDANSNAIILQHESRRDGLVTSGNDAETFDAVLAHTKMAMRMIEDGIKPAANEMLMSDVLAYKLSKHNLLDFGMYTNLLYDSTDDYWKLMNDGSLVNDNKGWLVDEEGNPILNSAKNKIGAEGIETGLLNILYGGTSGRSYSEFTDEQIFPVQAVMLRAQMTYKAGDEKDSPRKRTWTDNTTGQKLENDYLLSVFYNTMADAVFSKLSPETDRYKVSNSTPSNIETYIQNSSDYATIVNSLKRRGSLSEEDYSSATSQLAIVNTEAAISYIQDQLSPEEKANRRIYQQDYINAMQRLSELQDDAYANLLGDTLAKTALILAGGRYVYGAENPFFIPMAGSDCSGSVVFEMQLMGYDLPRLTADGIVKTFTTKVTDGTILPGDINAQLVDGHVSHVQTLIGGTGRIDPSGNESNVLGNPAAVRYRTTPLPSNFDVYRFDMEKIERYYNPSRDIMGGKLTVSEFNSAWERILHYSY